MATNNGCNFSLGTTGQVLTMTSSSTMAFSNSSSRSQSSVTRSLNTVYQISTTNDSLVEYSVDVSCSLSLTGGTTGSIYLEISTTSAFSTVQQICESTNGNTGTLTIGLNITQIFTGRMSGYIPAGYYVRIRTSNVTGTPTFTYQLGQEVLL